MELSAESVFFTLRELSSIPGTHKPEEILHNSSAVIFSLGSLEFSNSSSYAAESQQSSGEPCRVWPLKKQLDFTAV